jgi:hypothetical protein
MHTELLAADMHGEFFGALADLLGSDLDAICQDISQAFSPGQLSVMATMA